MPTVPKSNPIAVLVSDIHLSTLKPICRADKDWMEVQARYLAQLADIAREDELPILVAGDIFDRWNPTPELIHFALEHLPDDVITIPGQHDLPSHRLDLMHRSGYGVLVKAGKIRDASHGNTLQLRGFNLNGFGWEQEIKPPPLVVSGRMNVALIHRYFWMKDKGYPGAPESNLVSAYTKQLKGYQVAVTGDNHTFFTGYAGDCLVWNCGGFIRRKSDEIYRQPSVGVLHDDGTIERVKLDTSGDQFEDLPEKKEETPFNMREFIAGLEELGEHGLNYKETVENHLRKEDLHPRVKDYILKALEPTT